MSEDLQRFIVVKVDPTDPTKGTMVSDQNQTFYKVAKVAQRKADWYNDHRDGTYKVIAYDIPPRGSLNIPV